MRRGGQLSGSDSKWQLRNHYLVTGIRFILPRRHHNCDLHFICRSNLHVHRDSSGYTTTVNHLSGKCHGLERSESMWCGGQLSSTDHHGQLSGHLHSNLYTPIGLVLPGWHHDGDL